MAKSRTSGQGRPPGIPNKLTSDIKAMIIGALNDAGGQKYLRQQAEKSPAAFMTLVGKVLPTTITGPDDQPLFNGITVNLVRADKPKP